MAKVKLTELMKEKQLLSFEVFPPKTDKGMENLPGTIEKLCEFNPEYISCTYGAGGGNVGRNREVCQEIIKAGTTPVTHFTVIKNTKEGIKQQLEQYLAEGVDHMLALRGDIPLGETTTCGDFDYATDLVAFTRKEFGDKFEIAVAGSPEGHISCRSLDADIAVLKMKQDNGADYIMTQLLGYGAVQGMAGQDPFRWCYHAGRRRYHADPGSGSNDQHGTVPQRLCNGA